MKEMSRLTKEEKQELLDMFSNDRDNYTLAKTMCLKYLEVYPSEKKFKTKVMKLIKEFKYGDMWYNSFLKLELARDNEKT